MHPSPLPFAGYDSSADRPNIVVDGSANAGTVLTLSHWPGTESPPELADDLSAQMAHHYLDRPPDHPPAEVVTNNHFDQDGLVGIHALVDPEAALAHRELLLDVAAAGDFGTYRRRAAARASMALWTLAHPERSPLAGDLAGLDHDARTGALYEHALPRLVELATHPERFEDLWAEEDARLTASEAAIAGGAVTVEEDPGLDLAVVTIGADEPRRPGHQFGGGGRQLDEIHPMAVNNATRSVRVLLVHGRRHRYLDRYETWVRYRSRPLPARVDLRPLADELTADERDGVVWRADGPGSLSPQLTHDGESSLPGATVRERLAAHLRTAAPAWDPDRGA